MLVRDAIEFYVQMIDLFRQVDVNDDKTIDWEEFSAYIVQLGVNAGGPSGATASLRFRYEYVDGLDRTLHLTPVKALLPMRDPSTDVLQVATLESHTQMVRAQKPTQSLARTYLTQVRNFRHDTAFQPHKVLAMCWVHSLGLLLTSSKQDRTTHWLSAFDMATARLVNRMSLDLEVDILCFSEGCALVFLAGPGGQAVRGVCPRTFQHRISMPQDLSIIHTMVAVPGHLNTLLLSGSADGILRVWDARKGRCLPERSLEAHELGVRRMRLSRIADVVVTCGFGPPDSRVTPKHMNRVYVWPLKPWIGDLRSSGTSSDAAHSSRRRQGPVKVHASALEGHEYAVLDVSISDDLSVPVPHIVSLDEAGYMRVWHLHSHECLQTRFLLQSDVALAARSALTASFAAQRDAETAAAQREEDLILGRVGMDVETAAASQWMQENQGQVQAQAQPPRSAGGTQLLPPASPLRSASRASLPPVSASSSPSVVRGGQPLSPTATLQAGRSMSFARARAALYPERGEGRARRLFTMMVDPTRASKAPAALSTRRTADMELGKPAYVDVTPPPRSVSAFISGDAATRRKHPVTTSQYAAATHALDMHAKRQARAERASAARRLQRSAASASIQQRDAGRAAAGAGEEGLLDEVAAVASDSDDSESAAHAGAPDALSADDPRSEVCKPRKVFCIQCLPTECGGSERNALLVVGGDKLRVLAFTQEVPLLLPLVGTFFAEPTMSIVTVTASDVIVWDALTGRPLRVHSARALLGRTTAEISAACLDDRQRKLFIGDNGGHIKCFNLGVLLLSSAAFVKDLDPHLPGAAILSLQYLAGRAEVLSVGMDGQVQVCDDMNIEGYNAQTLNSCLLRRFPLPDPREVPFAQELLTLSAVEAAGDADASARSRDEAFMLRVQQHAKDTGVRSFYVRTHESAEELDKADLAGRGARINAAASATFMHRMRSAPILDSRVEVVATATSVHLNALATCSTGLAGSHWLLLWHLNKATPSGALSTFTPLPQGSAISCMAFLDPFPLLLAVDATGTFKLWVVPPGPGPCRLRGQWQAPPQHHVTCMCVAPAAAVPPMVHGAVGCLPPATLQSGVVVWTGDAKGRVHRWRLPAAALGEDPAPPGPRPGPAQRHLPDFRLPLLKLKSLVRHSLRSAKAAAGAPTTVEALPSAAHCETGVLWESAWAADPAALVSCTYLPGSRCLLTAGESGLARLWDNEGHLLGTLDTTPRFTAPEPTWAKPFSVEEEDHVNELSLLISGDATHPHGFPRADTKGDACWGPGTGSPYSDDRTSLRHVAVRRVYHPQDVREFSHRTGGQGSRAPPTPGTSLNSLLEHKLREAALARGLPPARHTTYTLVSRSLALPPGVDFVGAAPEQGIVYWHWRPNLLARVAADRTEARRFRAIITIMRAVRSGKVALARLLPSRGGAGAAAANHTSVGSARPTPPSRAPVDVDAEVRRVLEEAEGAAEERAQAQAPDRLRGACTLAMTLQARRGALQPMSPTDPAPSPSTAVQTADSVTAAAPRLSATAGLSFASRGLPPNKYDAVLGSLPDYGHSDFLAKLRGSLSSVKLTHLPAYFEEYRHMRAVAATASVAPQAYPSMLLSHAERARLESGTLFSDEPLTKFSHTARGKPPKASLKPLREGQLTMLLSHK